MKFAIQYASGQHWEDIQMRDGAKAKQSDYFEELRRRGRLVIAGETEGSQEIFVILECSTSDEADRIVARDPAVVAGIYAATVRRFVEDV